MSIIRQIQSIVAGDRSAEDHDTETTPSTSLYRCCTCDRTFVTDTEMETCSRCEIPVERAPTESDLGLL
jgi:rRNA maturation endonuclease Nob1